MTNTLWFLIVGIAWANAVVTVKRCKSNANVNCDAVYDGNTATTFSQPKGPNNAQGAFTLFFNGPHEITQLTFTQPLTNAQRCGQSQGVTSTRLLIDTVRYDHFSTRFGGNHMDLTNPTTVTTNGTASITINFSPPMKTNVVNFALFSSTLDCSAISSVPVGEVTFQGNALSCRFTNSKTNDDYGIGSSGGRVTWNSDTPYGNVPRVVYAGGYFQESVDCENYCASQADQGVDGWAWYRSFMGNTPPWSLCFCAKNTYDFTQSRAYTNTSAGHGLDCSVVAPVCTTPNEPNGNWDCGSPAGSTCTLTCTSPNVVIGEGTVTCTDAASDTWDKTPGTCGTGQSVTRYTVSTDRALCVGNWSRIEWTGKECGSGRIRWDKVKTLNPRADCACSSTSAGCFWVESSWTTGRSLGWLGDCGYAPTAVTPEKPPTHIDEIRLYTESTNHALCAPNNTDSYLEWIGRPCGGGKIIWNQVRNLTPRTIEGCGFCNDVTKCFWEEASWGYREAAWIGGCGSAPTSVTPMKPPRIYDVSCGSGTKIFYTRSNNGPLCAHPEGSAQGYSTIKWEGTDCGGGDIRWDKVINLTPIPGCCDNINCTWQTSSWGYRHTGWIGDCGSAPTALHPEKPPEKCGAASNYLVDSEKVDAEITVGGSELHSVQQGPTGDSANNMPVVLLAVVGVLVVVGVAAGVVWRRRTNSHEEGSQGIRMPEEDPERVSTDKK
eukprot:TRINITY_DN51738_c0_g1_i1.p1 TRINITY_DN51738_c0_g1~~TRINITY_DN51738_c0_g1_i1.p1  ORF type:complete len:751 (+),score=28.66 TRINITY_DN51738_c0_g1_i1:104-2254(+)